jgi:hypothetical protein
MMGNFISPLRILMITMYAMQSTNINGVTKAWVLRLDLMLFAYCSVSWR